MSNATPDKIRSDNEMLKEILKDIPITTFEDSRRRTNNLSGLTQALAERHPFGPEVLLAQYLGHMPMGNYHRRDDDPCGLYRDGSKVYDIQPKDAAAGQIVAVLVLLLNKR